MASKLTVYETQIGFYDLIVAAPSKAAALRAWGIHLDVFADGSARVATDEHAIEAAQAQPEVALKRAVGTDDAFGLNPGLPRMPDEPKAATSKTKGKRPPVKAPAKPAPPDRKALTLAEVNMSRVLEEQRADAEEYADAFARIAAEEQDLSRRRSALEAEKATSSRHNDAARSRAEKALERERQAYLKAGGDP